MNAEDVADLLGLEPLAREGGRWAQTWRDRDSCAIYFLLAPGDFSALHRLDAPEMWHHYAGAPVAMLLLGGEPLVARPILGDDLAAGQRPFVPVPIGVWMGAATTGEWSLVGTTMAPPFEEDGFELGTLDSLVEQYPSAAADIASYIRPEEP